MELRDSPSLSVSLSLSLIACNVSNEWKEKEMNSRTDLIFEKEQNTHYQSLSNVLHH